MTTTKSFEDGLREVEEKLEEIFTRLQKCCTQVHQEFSLKSDKVFKSVEAAEKEKTSKLMQAAPTKKLWISLGKRFEILSFQEQPYSKRVPRGPCKTAYLHEEIVINFHDYFYLAFTKGYKRDSTKNIGSRNQDRSKTP
nr:hypothetical protein [Tanacetum cinerariifolium]